MIATMICRVIGLLYRTPLHRIMGDVGDGYYAFAFEWYSMILLIASYSIPMAVSKVMAELLAVRQYKNAQKVFHAAFLYVIIVGGAGALFAYFGAPFLLSTQPGAVLALRVLAPTIFLSGILGVLRGYFQAHNTMTPTAISQVLEQIVNAIISIVAAWVFTRAYLGNEGEIATRGAAGGTLGTGAGVVTGIIVMLLIYLFNRKTIARRIAHDTTRRVKPMREVFMMILMMVTPVILATFVYNLSGIVDQLIFTRLMPLKGFSAEEISSQYALFGYQFKPIINIPIALASATSTALIPAVATAMAEGKPGETTEKIQESTSFMMLLAIPSAVGIAILSLPVIRILYPGPNQTAAAILLSIGAVSVVFLCLSTVSNGVLQGLGKPSLPVIHSAIALGVNALVLVVMILVFNVGVKGVLFATILYAVTVSILNERSVRKYLPYKANIRDSFVLPFAAAGVMGVVIALIYWLPAHFMSGLFSRYIVNAVWTMVTVLIGMGVYAIAYVLISGKSADELRQMPAGTRMLQVLGFLHIRPRG